MRYLLIIMVLVMGSCASDPSLDKLYIHGYTCGESIDNRTLKDHVVKRPEDVKFDEFRVNSRVRIVLIHDDIWIIKYDSIPFSEADSLYRRINDIYKTTPKISYSEVRATKQWLWRDPIWNDKIVLSKKHMNNPDSLYSLYFERPVSSYWVTR